MMIHDEKTTQAATRHDQQRIYEGNVFSFVSDTLTLAGQDQRLRREYIDHPGAVAIVPLRDGSDGPEVLLQSQYRHPVSAVLWEVPAGLLDQAGEDPLEAARRELAEEASLAGDTWHVLLDIVSSPGCTSEALRIYLARDLHEIEIDYERGEEEADMQPMWIGLDEACRLAAHGALHNGTTIMGLYATRAALADPSLLRPTDAPWQR